MDQLRTFLRVTWQQRFWVLAVVAPVVAAVCWMTAAGKLQAAFQSNKSTIEGHFSAMQSISSAPIHGNDNVNAREIQEASTLSQSVRELWQRLYDRQREGVLVWPAALDEDFIRYIEDRAFGDPIPNRFRTRYLDYIKTQFDKLVEIVDANKLEDDGAGYDGGLGGGYGREMMGGREGMGGRMSYNFNSGMPGEVRDYLVDWVDQAALREKLTFERQPTALQIWVTQEDLWVYETLLKVIAEVNRARGATPAADNAAIRVIQRLEVGSQAALASAEPGNIMMPAGAASDMGGYGMEGRGMGPEAMGGYGYGREGGMGMMEGQSVDSMLLQNRYIGPDGQPIADGSTGTGTEYRRLPVQMVLAMDQQWVPRLLVECANATLPIEVQRLRINPEQSGAGFDATISGTGGDGMGGGMERYGRGMGGGSYRAYGGGELPDNLGEKYVTIELQGLVYIFNPPSDAELTVPGAEEAGLAPGDELATTGDEAAELAATGAAAP